LCIKKIAGVLRAISGSDHPKNFTSVIIAAAGLSERFGGNTTKQMQMLCGVPVLLHTLKAYENTDCVHEIIIVARNDEISYWKKICKEYGITKVTKIVKGGDTRQSSVANGLEAIDERSKFVAVADGARCLITPEQITNVCRAAYKYKAATAAHKSTDTVKIADKKGFIDSTADRNTVWLAQTPQVFKTKLFRAASVVTMQKKFEGTDDNSLVEFVGHPIRLVECGAQNIKITTYDDLAVAIGVLKYRKENTPEIYYGADEND
jgi:2-C-methyl-D-erythritol 4-phosphate cytidylyltransferase